MSKDINQTSFAESTKLKLEILSDFFKEWFPVFIKTPQINKLYVFDLFAGSGTDIDGTYGSPLILLSEAKKFCKNNYKNITFIFNDSEKDKSDKLNKKINKYIKECSSNFCKKHCIYKYNVENQLFQEYFFNNEIQHILQNNEIAKFLFLDQYGIKEINKEVFNTLINSPKTDFIFFISSSIVKRFKDIPEIKQYIDINNINVVENGYDKSHLVVLEYYKSLIPKDMEYYIHGFSIKRGANYYGLIFGSSHTLGMEKFLNVCWKHDQNSGESNHNINNDDTFFGIKSNNKKTMIENNIRSLILNKQITTNIDGFKYAMKNGCKPELFKKVIKEMEKDKKVELKSCNNLKVSYASTNIHKVDKYTIEVL